VRGSHIFFHFRAARRGDFYKLGQGVDAFKIYRIFVTDGESRASREEETPPIYRLHSAMMADPFVSVQQSIVAHLTDAPASPCSDVCNLRAVARTIQARHQPAGSRAVHRLVERGVLESMTPT
jgi:hypothetical protein